MDIEYQTYGFVSNIPREEEDSFYWEHPGHKHCLRIVCQSASGGITGINVLGMRLRQEVCESWIKEGQTLEHALENLPDAVFDPEFFKQYEPEIVSHYNRMNPARKLTLKRKRGGLRKFFSRENRI